MKENQLNEDNFAKPKQSVTIEGWVCRDKGGDLYLFGDEPYRESTYWDADLTDMNALELPHKSFPDLKWEDDPLKCKITIEEI